MDQVGHADSKTLEIYAQVQKRVSRKNVHAALVDCAPARAAPDHRSALAGQLG